MDMNKINKVEEYILNPRFDSRKSFYGKAKVKMVNGKKVLQSYNTDVAEIIGGKPYVKGTYSQTTTRHIKEFLKQSGFRADTSKQILKDYGKPPKVNINGQMQKQNDMMKTTVGIAKLGDIFGKTTKESNAWKKRMLQAGFGNKGLSFPDDWEKLSEKEKKKRLNKAMNVFG